MKVARCQITNTRSFIRVSQSISQYKPRLNPPPPAGLGWGMIVVSALVAIYYNLILAWTLFYTFASFTSVLPWGHCDNDFNSIGECGRILERIHVSVLVFASYYYY